MATPASDISIEGPAPDISTQALSDIGRQTFIHTFGHLYARADLDGFLESSHAPANYAALLDDAEIGIWIAREASDNSVIGYLVAGPCHLPVDDMPARSGELIRFYVMPDFQGGGLGKRMLDVALEWLSTNFDHIYLSVYAENYGAQRLYARYGFEKVKSYHFMVGTHADPEFILKRKSP